MVEMKIVAGLGSIDDYEEYVEAGADKLFCGYVPHEYVKRFGRSNPLNRREVIYYNVSLGSESELMILAEKVKKYKVPVSIAINGLCYEPEQLDYIESYVKRCCELGFYEYIVADGNLINRLSKKDGIKIEISGEYGELNKRVIAELSKNKILGFIFPRQTDISEIKILISEAEKYGVREFEAFALNEKCHYTGAYCNSLHCDEMCHICKVPYHLNNKAFDEEDIKDCIGGTGCGICKLWKFREVGVTQLKIVSRGNGSLPTIEDIGAMKKARDILRDSETEEVYIKKVKEKLFPHDCSHNCY